MLYFQRYLSILYFAEKVSGKTYYYDMKQRPSCSRRPSNVGSDHGDDLFFMFGGKIPGKIGVFPVELSAEDKQVADLMFKYWTNFAKSA